MLLEEEGYRPSVKARIGVVLLGMLECAAYGAFIYGYFWQNQTLMIFGGGFQTLHCLIEGLLGVLSPPAFWIPTVIGAIVASPWYVGVFWANSFLNILNIPRWYIMLLRPGYFVKMMRAASRQD
jgi:hypothetical protein